MLFLLTILVVALFIAAAFLVKRHLNSSQLEEHQLKNLPEPAFRPLFEPTEKELRAAAKEEDERLTAEQNEQRLKTRAEKVAKLDEFRQTWASSPDKRNTVELLVLASESESGEAFAEIAESVVEKWRAGAIADLSSDDLAQIVESHFWLLPLVERTAGVSFRLNREVVDLRTRTTPSAKPDTPHL